jgi:hypothetical protein
VLPNSSSVLVQLLREFELEASLSGHPTSIRNSIKSGHPNLKERGEVVGEKPIGNAV